ncbi:MAG: MiaB/RimO family radical SAM methylthiotransferase [Planctomycetota bacterium]|jgi:threonylcarbamoyladenosine tRNA methylthiotransferase MtaB|nr:MiaB/RimO family radical SAM methylthiotransferase [Planctomycetota bacterium]
MPPLRRFFLQTLGCKTNQYDSQAMREALLAAGFAEAKRLEEAELFLLNTCAVTRRAGDSGRRAIRRAARLNPSLRMAIIGCGVDLGEAVPETASGPPLLLKNAEKAALPGLLKEWLGEGSAAPAGGAGLSVSGHAGHSRAFLKIQDGCGNFCSYCAVPLARGAPRSRPPGEIREEAGRLIAAGFGELTLTGVNIGAYRRGNLDLAGLAEELAGTPGLVRLRLGSVEPPRVDARLVRIMRDSGGKICPHIHMPLQSGDDRLLAAMNRDYPAAGFLEKVSLLRDALDLPALGSDVMVGFPDEDAASFANTLEVCRRAGFSRLHVFPFSPRPGTPAAAWRRELPEQTLAVWKTRLIRLGMELAAGFARRCLGREERIIMERDGGLSDRYLKTRLKGRQAGPGAVVRARITATAGAELLGEAVDAGETPF